LKHYKGEDNRMTIQNATETNFAVTTTVPGFITAAEIISQLRAEYDGVTPDVSTPLAMAKTVAARKKFRDAYVALDKAKPEIKREALEFCKTVESDYKSLRVACVEFFDIFDTAIKAEENRKEAIKEQQRIEAAAAQKILDDKIIEIGKLPLRCIDMTADEITLFIAKLDATPIGGEFTGDTRERAEAAKEEAITAIRDMLTAKVKAEEIAAALKAEQESEAERVEAERIEREAAEKIQREAMAAQQAELDEQKRLQEIEAARLAEEKAENEAAMLKASEELRIEREQRDVERRKIEKEAEEKQAAIDAENKRIADEAAAAQREIERQAAISAEAARKKADTERKAAEKMLKLQKAKCADAATAFGKILDICNNPDNVSDLEARAQVAIIAEAML
jgi:hypothetical protein